MIIIVVGPQIFHDKEGATLSSIVECMQLIDFYITVCSTWYESGDHYDVWIMC